MINKAFIYISILTGISCGYVYSDPLLPEGGVVEGGSGLANITQSQNNLNVSQSTDKAVINWQSFNIGAGNTVNFQVPSTSSATLNSVPGTYSVTSGNIVITHNGSDSSPNYAVTYVNSMLTVTPWINSNSLGASGLVLINPVGIENNLLQNPDQPNQDQTEKKLKDRAQSNITGASL